jgi:beta-galactosidase
MQYVQGKGGIVLCNLLLKDSESQPENVGKKRAIVAAILRNLNASMGSDLNVVVGTPMAYAPVDISSKANQYRTAQGWFGDKNHTFADLPAGDGVFAGVRFNIYHFATSPVPEAIMLGGKGIPNNLPDAVKDIPVNQKADALFFLQAARKDSPRNANEIRDRTLVELAKYVVHFVDGQSVDVPIGLEVDVDGYIQKEPMAIAGAQMGWSTYYGRDRMSAVAYVKQWNNPRPDVRIKSVDLVRGKDAGRGVVALLAVTAATVQK